MIRKKNDMDTEKKEEMRGGTGVVNITHMVKKEELQNGRLFARLLLPAGSSIGPHTHEGETEYYVILSGQGEVTETEGTKPVSPGDIVITGDGESHSISNTGSDPLEFLAVIIYDEK